MYKNAIVILISILLILSLQSCSRQPHVKNGHVVSVAANPVANTLFYTGTIQPLNTTVIPSPADGVIVEMPTQYGETVQKGQLLFAMSSAKFLSDYKISLLAYLKAKSDFTSSKAYLDEAILLHKNELISDDDFKSKQTNYYTAQLALLQAKDALQVFTRQLNIKDEFLYKLSIADIDKITNAIHLQTNADQLRIFANEKGTLLSSTKHEEENKKFIKGDLVKQGDLLAIIGDMSGIIVRVKANELVVNQLKIGQKVKVTGIAFPDEILQGKINRVDRQGEVVSGALPTFNVEVIVPTLTEEQQLKIHAGMSAKVEIMIEETPQIMVPIKAVSENNGESCIKVYNEKTGKVNTVAVKTGKTTIDSVAVLSGLKSGEKIVIPD